MSKDIEELLKIVEGASSEAPKTIEHKDSKVKDFLEEYSIEHGTDRIDNYIIYYTYKEKFKGSVSKVELGRQLSKSGFVKVRTGKKRSWLMNGSSFDLSREGKLRAKFYEKEEKQKK